MRFALLTVFACFWLAFPSPSLAGLTSVEKDQQVTNQKLSPTLAAARAAGGSFVGYTLHGRVVVDTSGDSKSTLDIKDMQLLGDDEVTSRELAVTELILRPVDGANLSAISLDSESEGIDIVPFGQFLLARKENENLWTANDLMKLEANPQIAFVDPNTPLDFLSAAGGADSGPDELLGQQWYLSVIHANSVLPVPMSPVIVAVIDSGIDTHHPDLHGVFWQNPEDINLTGWDFYDDDNDVSPTRFNERHGTGVVGLISAVRNNKIGIAGAASNAKIMALRAADAFGSNQLSVARAIYYAVENGARVINLSLGTMDSDVRVLEDAVRFAAANNVLVVAAAGNIGFDNDAPRMGSRGPTYPASFPLPNVISVLATSPNDVLWKSSNYGASRVHIGAPGEGLVSTALVYKRGDSGYYTFKGTSFSAPLVTAAAALVLGVAPNLSVEELRSRILNATRPIQPLGGKCTTGGMLDFSKLNLTVPSQPSLPKTSSPQNTFNKTPGLEKKSLL
jgi:subtilisin family serine protease